MITELVRRYRFMSLRIKAGFLIAQLDHAEDLLADHQRRYRVLESELSKVQRRMSLVADPQTLIKETA